MAYVSIRRGDRKTEGTMNTHGALQSLLMMQMNTNNETDRCCRNSLSACSVWELFGPLIPVPAYCGATWRPSGPLYLTDTIQQQHSPAPLCLPCGGVVEEKSGAMAHVSGDQQWRALSYEAAGTLLWSLTEAQQSLWSKRAESMSPPGSVNRGGANTVPSTADRQSQIYY